jgi:hypothetical protein
MSYNQSRTTAPIRGLINAGADLMKNMYDIRIFFPSSSGQPEDAPFAAYPVTVRAKGFKIPDIGVKVYPIKYHGVEIRRTASEQVFDRKFNIDFREDAAFDLRRRFTAWLQVISDPVTGGVSNATQFFGRIEVGTIAGSYFATTLNSPNGTGKKRTHGARDVEDDYGQITSRNDVNPLALWKFYNVWVEKITGIDFQTEDASANNFSVDFQFMDYDAPQFGGNTLGLSKSVHDTWKDHAVWTSLLDR